MAFRQSLLGIGVAVAAFGLAGCSWVESHSILAPVPVGAWVETEHPPQVGAPPYALFKQDGLRLSVNAPVLGGVTMIGPGYFPIFPVPDSPDKVKIEIAVQAETGVTLDPRHVALAAPCGPGAKPVGDGFAHTLVVLDYDFDYVKKHPGGPRPPPAPVETFPVTLAPGHILFIQIFIDAKPGAFEACTVRFGDLAGNGTAIPDLSFKRGHFTHWDWD